MNAKHLRRWIKRNSFIITALFLCLGTSLYVISSAFIKSELIKYFSVEVSISLATNAILLFLSLLYFKDEDSFIIARQIYENNGLVMIYSEKNDTYKVINQDYLLTRHIKSYDIICCGGLTTLIKAEGEKIINYAKAGMKVRILTANPNTEYLMQFKLDEEMLLTSEKNYNVAPLDNTLKRDIYNLYEWVQKANSSISDKNQIQVKFYRSLPSLQYHRVDDNVFVSSRQVGLVSKASPTYEYENTGRPDCGFRLYTKYFEDLWNDPNFASESPEMLLNPRLLIHDTTVDNILRMACVDLAEAFGHVNVNYIRAVLSIYDYPKPTQDGRKRRYNTNIARGKDIVDISQSNGAFVDGHNIGYVADDEKHVTGLAYIRKETQFGCIKDEYTCAILSIPLMSANGDVNSVLSFEFSIELKTKLEADSNRQMTPESDIQKKSKLWALLLINYLRIDSKI